ncbi:MAG: MFS superfamily sulfate permease-like transporter [Crocinitomicaceae bacterium]
MLLGDDPSIYAGEGPVELLMNVPNFISHAHWHIAVVGILGLIVMFGLPLLKVNFLKKLPAPMFVLTFTIPLSIYWHFKDTEAAYSLVSIGDFWGTININANFSMMGSLVFWKFVFMFLFVGTLESLLTVKAIDNIDPYKRESDYNSDLKAQGAANVLAGLLGGLPMISEVVRSSANVGFGAKTKWSNFFHGVFLLIAMLMLIPAIELIPNAALAAMLIYAGYRLAAPKEFFHAYKVGIEQLVIFSTTILVTLAEDLLLGVLAGIVVKFIFHLSRGATLKHMFKAHVMNTSKDNVIHLHVYDVAVFSNLGGFKKILKGLPEQEKIVMNMRRAKLIDHSFMTFIDHFKNEYNDRGGEFVICGLDEHKSLSAHPLSTKRKLKRAERTREFQ